MYKPAYRPDIDALRGISVAIVVIYHAFPQLLPGGFIGVDVFFVISGFLITSIVLGSLENGNFSILEFYDRRIRRLFPALVAVLSFTLLAGWLVLFPDELSQLGRHVWSAAIFLLNFELIGEIGYFDVESHYKPLLHFWSLSIEEQYYLLWPLLLLGFLKVFKSPLLFFAMVFVVSIALNIVYVDGYQETVYFHTATRFWQLAAGSVLAVVMLKQTIKERNYLYYFGVALVLGASLFITSATKYPGAWALLPVIGASLVIVSNSGVSRFLGLRALGLVSYPLYLWHWVLISFAFIYLGRKPPELALGLIIVASLFLAWFTWRYVEKLRYSNGSGKYLALSLLAVMALGFLIDREQGMPDRSHIAYYTESSAQFTRTPATDEACGNYVQKKLGADRLFYYCRGENLDLDKWVALVGDSHAHAWFPGLSSVAREHGYGTLLLANSSCPPLAGFEWGRNENEKRKCQESISQIASVLRSEKRIRSVLITTRGPVYMHGEVQGVFTNQSVVHSLDETVDNVKLTYDAYFSGLRSNLDVYETLRHIDNVFYLIENPELDFLPKEVVPRPFDIFTISTNRNYMDRELYLMRMARYRSDLNKLSYEKLELLDPMDALCDESKCYSFIDGQFVYADDDHFSVYGSQLVTEYFEDRIFKDE